MPTKKNPKIKPTFFKGPNDQNVCWGTISVSCYLILWVLSLLSPIIGITLLYFHYYNATGLLVLTVAMCYIIPWPLFPALRRFMAKGSIKYFRNCSLTYETLLTEQHDDGTKEKMLLAVHPHGIFCMGWAILFGRTELDHFQFCFSTALYNSPFFRVLSKLVGHPAPADKKNFKLLMKKGQSIALIPGGFESATITSSNQQRVHVGKKGFIKYCLLYGYSIVPCYVFNENQTYYNVQGCFKWRLWLNTFGLPAIVPFGKWWCPILPKSDVDLHVVCGTPLQLPLLKEPTRKEIQKWHSIYVKHLTKLYNDHKGTFGIEEDLEVWVDE